jgi:hypothetical protein
MLYYFLVFVASYAISLGLIWLMSNRRHLLLPISGIAILASLFGVYAVVLLRKKGQKNQNSPQPAPVNTTLQMNALESQSSRGGGSG